jgi:hypothetical protein
MQVDAPNEPVGSVSRIAIHVLTTNTPTEFGRYLVIPPYAEAFQEY